jgi:hypothetical protein
MLSSQVFLHFLGVIAQNKASAELIYNYFGGRKNSQHYSSEYGSLSLENLWDLLEDLEKTYHEDMEESIKLNKCPSQRIEDRKLNFLIAYLALAQQIIRNCDIVRRSYFQDMYLSHDRTYFPNSFDEPRNFTLVSRFHLLIQLLHYSLPQLLKAQILRTIGAFAETHEEAVMTWKKLSSSPYLSMNIGGGDEMNSLQSNVFSNTGLFRCTFLTDYEKVESVSGVFPITVALFDVFRCAFS